MTISKERFEAIALEVAKDHWDINADGDWFFDSVANAHALIKRVGDEQTSLALDLAITRASADALASALELLVHYAKERKCEFSFAETALAAWKALPPSVWQNKNEVNGANSTNTGQLLDKLMDLP